MHRNTSFRLVTAIVAICLAGAALTARATSSPNLDKATDALKAAQRADTGGAGGDPNDPTVTAAPMTPQQIQEVTTNLQEAMKWLNKATNQKGGEKGSATSLVKDAMDKVKTGDRAGTEKAIQQALDGIFAAAHHRGGWQG